MNNKANKNIEIIPMFPLLPKQRIYYKDEN